MYTEKNKDALTGEETTETGEDSQDSTLRWLLDMDMSEPEERLFTVDDEAQVEVSLSEYELDVASRPMERGSAGADDLNNYVNEEIVMSSASDASDIYAGGSSSVEVGSERASGRPGGSMAVDYSRPTKNLSPETGGVSQEGVDILGLSDDDDMGEKYFVLKRTASTEATAETRPSAPQMQAPSATSPASGESASKLAGESSEPGSEVRVEDASRPASLSLSEAPALRLVGQASDPTAASYNSTATTDHNEAEEPLESDVKEVAANAENVFGYIADVKPPLEDNEFDQYLLNGDQLEDGSPDFDELTIDAVEGETSFDTELDTAIDYHEDFGQLVAQGDEAAFAEQPMLQELRAEIIQAVSLRLETLGLDQSLVLTEIRQGRDLASAANLLKDGFKPVAAVCIPSPVALQKMPRAESDEIFVRFVLATTGDNCNTLFRDDFVVPNVNAEPFIEDAAGNSLMVEEPLADELEDAVSLWVEEPVAEEPTDTVSGLQEQPQAFDNVVAISHPASEPSLIGDVEDAGPLADDLKALGGFEAGNWQLDDTDIENTFADFGGQADESDDTVGTLHAESVEEPAAEQSDEFQVFGDDIFADELNSEVAGSYSAPQSDIDALFDSLGDTAEDSGEVCGLDVHEFSSSQADEEEHAAPATVDIQEVAKLLPEVAEQFWCVPPGISFSEASIGGGEIFADFLDAFIEEGSSEVEKLEDAITAWEKDVASEPAYTVVSRILHTVKGIAKGVGLQFYGTLIHNFETLLGAMPRPEAGNEGEYFRIVNAWLDAVVRGIDHIQGARADITNVLPVAAGGAPVEVDAALAEVSVEKPVTLPEITATEQRPVEQAAPISEAREKQLAKKMADDGARALANQQSVRITSDKLDHLLNLTNQAQQLSVRTAQSVTRSKRASSEMQTRLASVRAHIASIADRALRSVTPRGGKPGEMDALEMDQYSELQEAANILREGVEDLADLVDFATRQNAQVEALLKQQTNVISSIGSSIRAARVVPVSRLIPGLRRLVRTVSVDLEKTVSFQVLNELGTLDRDDYARCQTILDHMVRNALDHGIESASERAAAGKPASGQVTIDIRKAGADAIITLADDGRGIDPEKMRESACRKGLDIDADALSDDEAVRLIFHKGFSTASTVSQISGRGVGMDIVLSELQEMGGDIQIESVPGRGTAFHIRVPSSITVNGALMVSAGGQSYAIPLGGLIAVEQVPVADFLSAVENGTRLSLSQMDCEPAYLATLCQAGHFPDAKTWQNSVPVIIAGSPERYMAIAIDDVEEALELVIRSLGTQFSTVPGVAGAATTAAGEAIVALDLNLLVASVGTEDHSSLRVDAVQEEALLALVVDDSRTQRMVATSQLETVGVETITAENGAVAIDLLNTAERLPDIILLDVEMPVKDGIQTLREIRKSVRYGHIPVIMITSRTGLKHRALAQQAGCNGYMGKPFNFRMLVGQINELTGHRLELS